MLNRISIKRVSGKAVETVKEKKLKAAQQKFDRARKSAESAQEQDEDADSALMKSFKAVQLNMELKYAEQESAHQENLIICVSQGRVQKDC